MRIGGFSWRGAGAWTKYGCAKYGAHRPVLFPLGLMQGLSRRLVETVADDPNIRAFVRRSSQLIELSEWDRTEDVAPLS